MKQEGNVWLMNQEWLKYCFKRIFVYFSLPFAAKKTCSAAKRQLVHFANTIWNCKFFHHTVSLPFQKLLLQVQHTLITTVREWSYTGTATAFLTDLCIQACVPVQGPPLQSWNGTLLQALCATGLEDVFTCPNQHKFTFHHTVRW